MLHQRIGGDIATQIAIPAAWPNIAAEAATASAAKADDAEARSFTPTPAMADVPAAVGRLLVFAYAGLILIFLGLFANSALALFSIAVCAGFVAIFFAVPAVFLRIEDAPARRPTMAAFLRNGLQTLTGHSGGGDALVQMLIIPVFLTLGLAAIGVIGRFHIG